MRGLVSYGDTTYAVTYSNGTFKLTRNGVVSGVKEGFLPAGYKLSQNYPNPFNPSTTIHYQLSASSHVRIGMFNLIGQEVAILVDREEQEGYHSVQFDAAGLPSGAYFYRLEAPSTNSQSKVIANVKKMLLIK